MSENTSSTESTSEYEQNTWQNTLERSTKELDKSKRGSKRASTLLWAGAQEAVGEWLPNASDDVSGENLYSEVLAVLGKSRKGDASKIKTVAMAAAHHGLILAVYPNLSKAYSEAVRLTKTVQTQVEEDDAAEKAVAALAANVPNSTTTVEGAAMIVLSKGVDGAVVAILDALNGPSGKNNESAHRAFMRSVSAEIASRVQASKPKTVAKVAGPKKGATPAKPVTAGEGAAKAKPAPEAAPKAKPAKAGKAKPIAKAAPKSPDFSGVQSAPSKAVPVRRAVPVKR